MKAVLKILFVGAVATLAACTSISEVKDERIEGTEFGHYLAREYRELALYEANVKHDNAAADYFSERAIASNNNLFVEPSLLEEYDNIPQERMAELAHARTELIVALLAMKKPDNYKPLAKAQVKFDCWLENTPEKNGQDLANSCKADFLAAMDEVIGNIHLTEAFMVFFPLNSVRLDKAAMQTLMVVARILKENEGIKVVLTGNTDTTGPESYNDTLSMRRARAVQKALHDLDVEGTQMELFAGGEHNLLVVTPDNTKELKNRRVDILISKK
jgi:outer membrane protein OmpA-like peptidoglycan-associated protein